VTQHVELQWNYEFPVYAAVTCVTLYDDNHPYAQQDEADVMAVVYGAETMYHYDIFSNLGGGSAWVIDQHNFWPDVITNAFYHPENRDFFFLGHANGNAIGIGNNFLTPNVLKNVLLNLRDAAHANYTNLTPYRFVFIDGCQGANGTFPDAFGISKKDPTTRAGFIREGRRPRAFVGWPTVKQSGYFDFELNSQSTFMYGPHVDFLRDFWQHWSLNRHADGSEWGLKEALFSTTNDVDIYGVTNLNSTVGNVKIYGAQDLLIDN
jgi:hypothetical protein